MSRVGALTGVVFATLLATSASAHASPAPADVTAIWLIDLLRRKRTPRPTGRAGLADLLDVGRADSALYEAKRSGRNRVVATELELSPSVG